MGSASVRAAVSRSRVRLVTVQVPLDANHGLDPQPSPTIAEKETVQRLFKRNTNGVLRTDYYWLGRADPVSIKAPVAKKVLEEMRSIENEGSIAFQGTELGSIEGNVIEAIAHYGKPAVRIRHRVSEQEITCLIPSNREDEIGRKHSWNEVWGGQRYVVTGEIKRKANGDIAQLLAVLY